MCRSKVPKISIISVLSLLCALFVIADAYASSAGTNLTISAPASMAAGNSATVSLCLTNEGAPVSFALVNLSVTGAGSVSPLNVVTDTNGYATVTFTASAAAGVATLTATGPDGAVASSPVQVLHGPPASLNIYSSDSTLIPSNTGKQFTYTVKIKDSYGNVCNGTVANLTTDGVKSSLITGADGTFTAALGPRQDSHTYNVTVESGGVTSSFKVRFMLPVLLITGVPATVTAGSNISMTAWLLDDMTPAPGILLNFSTYSPDNLAAPASYSAYTDASGRAVFNFTTSTKSGFNIVVVNNSSLGDLSSAMVKGLGGSTSNIILSSDPVSPIVADGTGHYKVKIWAKDTGGNPVKNEDLDVIKNGILVYTVTTNTNGYAELDMQPSAYVGDVMITVRSSGTGANGTILLSYIAGPPAMTVIKAVPNVIASSEIDTPAEQADVHTTQLIGLVTDRWYHPIAGQPITITSLNTTAGYITGPGSGITDSNGEFYTNFRLGNFSNGTGTVNVRANSGSLESVFPITYTNTTFLSMETSISPRNISVNDTINVDISLRGIGWNNRPQPVDVMLITDRSGSMAWLSTVVYPTNGPAKQGTLPTPNNREYLIDTYTNTKHSTLQFMLSSPYSNYADNSYYYSLRIVDPSGRSYSGTNSANENYYMFTNARTGTYKIYGRFNYDPDGGIPQYSLAVLTEPLRLGSSYDVDSAAKVAAVQFVNNMSTQDQVGLVSHNTAGTLDRPLKLVNGTNKTSLITAINGLNANGGTNIYTGMQKARQEFVAHGRSEYKDVAIILTDGYSQSPGSDIAEAYNFKNAGITAYTIGMGMPDEPTLSSIANITGGKYYRVASDLELAQRYRDIATDIKDVIANQSEMDIVTRRTVINGSIISDAEYVNHSAWVTFTNSTRSQIEPSVYYDNTRYVLSWDPGQIKVNEIWRVEYQLQVKHGGLLMPITNESFVSFTRADGTQDTSYFVGESIFCNDNPNGTLINDSSTMSVKLLAPGNESVISQSHQPVTWNLHYVGVGQYTQAISVMPEGGSSWNDLATGFGGDRNSAGTYSYIWKLDRLPAGNYTIRVFASDGTYDSWDTVTVNVPYESGKIILE